ncbi:MAG: hypothetical protein K8R37_15140 [Bacteroidales bacterium]|nr:hypothetical protein [Bacteroidales bacterium]
MDKKKTISIGIVAFSIGIGALMIASAIIWGTVGLGCSSKLEGTECYDQIQNIIVGGTFAHLILIMGPLGAMFVIMKKQREEEDK